MSSLLDQTYLIWYWKISQQWKWRLQFQRPCSCVTPQSKRLFSLNLCCFRSHLNYSCTHSYITSRNCLTGTNVGQQPPQSCHLMTLLWDKATNNFANNRFITTPVCQGTLLLFFPLSTCLINPASSISAFFLSPIPFKQSFREQDIMFSRPKNVLTLHKCLHNVQKQAKSKKPPKKQKTSHYLCGGEMEWEWMS